MVLQATAEGVIPDQITMVLRRLPTQPTRLREPYPEQDQRQPHPANVHQTITGCLTVADGAWLTQEHMWAGDGLEQEATLFRRKAALPHHIGQAVLTLAYRLPELIITHPIHRIREAAATIIHQADRHTILAIPPTTDRHQT